MEKIVEQGMLYEFYGELLTDHQKKIYECVVYHDLSLSEIAEEQGITRQGVHDLIRRCNITLQDYESKLHLISKFENIKEKVQIINQISQQDEIKQLTNQILEEL